MKNRLTIYNRQIRGAAFLGLFLWATLFAGGGGGRADTRSSTPNARSSASVNTQSMSAAPQANILAKYTDEAALRGESARITQAGYHVRHALRGWLETPPSRVFGESIGISFGNVPRPQIDAAMQHLARSGIEHVRIEAGWVALDVEGKIVNEDLRLALVAAKKHNLRPLVLLNAHEGVPCPQWQTRVTLLAPASKGDRFLYVPLAQDKNIHLHRTGFNHATGAYRAGDILVAQKWPTTAGHLAAHGHQGQALRLWLSKPLHKDLPKGEIEMSTLLAAPLWTGRKEWHQQALWPAQMDTLHKWIGRYVKPLTRQLDTLVGKGKYDVEVGNELMFGAAWFAAGDQYYDEETRKMLGWTPGHPLLDELVKRTADYIHQHHPGVEIVHGFTSQNMWTTSDTEITTERHSRHFYVPFLKKDGITYWYPEQTASSDYDAISTMALDLMPISYNQFGRNNHSWNPDGTPGPASALTQTEGGSVPEYAKQQPGVTLTDADSYHLRAKWEIRALLFFANKGGINKDGRGTRYYLYTLREGDKVNYHQIARPEFFAHLKENNGVYPGTPEKEAAVTAKTFAVIKRTRSYLPIAPKIVTPRSLKVERISERHGNVQVAEGPHGKLHNRDVLAVLPFQTADTEFAVGLYVQTLNLAKEYRKGTDPTRFDLPDEEYEIRLGGLKWREGMSSASLVDMMTGSSVAITPSAPGVFRVKLTDAPRLLVLKGA